MTDSIFLETSGCECDVTLDTWLRDALPLVPGIVRSVAARELVLTAREFYERSYAWRGVIGPANAREALPVIWTSPFDDYASVVGIIQVEWKNLPIAFLARRPPDAADVSATDPQGWFMNDPPDAIELYPALSADSDGAIVIHVALTPKQSVEHLPRIAAILHYDALLDGFLARVYAHPNKPYSQPMEAARRRRMFVAAIGRYQAQAKLGQGNGQVWSFPRFGA